MLHDAPLTALRAFEAAARTGSFSAAARELGVTSAAVSQQVKILEEFWGKMLFIRHGNRIALTEAGLSAYPALAHTMTGLRALSDKMQAIPSKTRLVLSVPTSVADTWLASRLAGLMAAGKGGLIEVYVQDDPIDFALDRVDMRVFYGHNLYNDYRVEALFHDSLIALAAPGFVTQYGDDVASIPDQWLIHTDWGRSYASSPDWSDHLSDLRLVDLTSGPRVSTSSLALAMARQGLGVALAPARMAEGDLARGGLVRLPVPARSMQRPFAIAYPNAQAERPLVRAVIAALAQDLPNGDAHDKIADLSG